MKRSETMLDMLIKNGLVYQNGSFQKTNIMIKDGVFVEISNQLREAKEVYDAEGFEVIPGLIDPHVHFGLDLGFIRSVDDFDSGTVAALYGGVTSIVDFLAPTDGVKDLLKSYQERLHEAKKARIDYAFHATIKDPKDDLEAYVKTVRDLDMRTLKLFTTYSDSKRRTYDQEIIRLLNLSRIHDIMILAHVENDDMIHIDPDMTHEDLPRSRPVEAEITEALKLASYVKETKGHLYMVHVSSGETIRRLKAEYPELLGKHFMIESCPQYFTFDQSALAKANGYLYACAPPLRTQDHVQKLFDHQALIDVIGTDHCTFMKADKANRKLFEMPLGIGGIEHSFAVMRSHLGDVVIDKMTKHPARLHKLRNKGSITVGYDADLFVFKNDPNTIINGHHGTCDYTLYEGLKSAGTVISTMVRGQFAMRDGVLMNSQGQLIKGDD